MQEAADPDLHCWFLVLCFVLLLVVFMLLLVVVLLLPASKVYFRLLHS